jgi:hypothetical protein
MVAPALFREILAFSLECYEIDRATYHVSADPRRVPLSSISADTDLPGILDHFDGREVLHVTFGSVLDQFGPALLSTLDEYEEEHYAALEAHFRRHLASFNGMDGYGEH